MVRAGARRRAPDSQPVAEATYAGVLGKLIGVYLGRPVEGWPYDAADFGDTWLNTIIEDKTILWWGGFGRSTEHTAYLRLKTGYRAPQSGSCALNGATLSTQIGAQIFTDPLALMSPGGTEQAAALIRKAASVSHDGVALHWCSPRCCSAATTSAGR